MAFSAGSAACQWCMLSGIKIFKITCFLSITLEFLSAHTPIDPVPSGGAAGMPGILEVDPASGATTLYLPLGPGIGNRGLHYTPALVGRFAPQAGMIPAIRANGELANWPTLLATSAFELSPGFLDLPLVLMDQSEGPGQLQGLRWTYPDGSGGRSGMAFPFGVSAKAILTRFGYGPSVTLGNFPSFGSAVSVPFLLPGTAGDYLLALSDDTLFPAKKVTFLDAQGEPAQWVVPSCLLAVRGDLAYEYELVESSSPEMRKTIGFAHYWLATIRSISGEVMTFSYGPNGVDFEATWEGTKVRVTLEGLRGTAPVPAMDGAFFASPREQTLAFWDVEAHLRITYEGSRPPTHGYTVIAMARPEFRMVDGRFVGGFRSDFVGRASLTDSFRRSLQVTLVHGEAQGETIQFGYGKAPLISCSTKTGSMFFAPTVLQEINIPGRSMRLDWQGHPCRRECMNSTGSSKQEGWSYGVDAVQDFKVDSEGDAQEIPMFASNRHVVRQLRHFAVAGGPCQTYVRDRSDLLAPGGPKEDFDSDDPQSRSPYRNCQDIPTFCMDPEGLFLIQVSGQLTRWINGIDESKVHQWSEKLQTGLLGGGNGGSKSGGGGKGDAGPTSGNSLAAIHAYDRSHSKPGVIGGHASNGDMNFSSMREINDKHRQEALDHATNSYLGQVGTATATGVGRGVVSGSAGGPPGSVGAGIVSGVAGMGVAAVGGGIKLAKERERIERAYQENKAEIDRTEAQARERDRVAAVIERGHGGVK